MKHTRIIRRTISRTEGWINTIEKIGRDQRRKEKKDKERRVTIGIDASLVGTGVAVFDEGKLVNYKGWTDIKSLQKKHPDRLIYFKPKERNAAARLARIRMVGGWIAGIVADASIYDLCVAIEGYAFAARGSGASDLHELGGYVKQALLTLGVPFRIYDPLSIKLAATGSGSADKGDMKIACLKKLKLDVTTFGKAGENIADACMIAWLLEQERAIRDGHVQLEKAPPDVRRVLLRTTKAEPVAFISQPWICEKAIDSSNLRYD